MGKYSAADIGVILLNGYDLRPYVTELDENTSAQFEETHVFGDSWVSVDSVDLASFEATLGGFYDDSDNGPDEALVGPAGTEQIFCYGVETNAVNKQFVAATGAFQSNYQRVASRGALHKFKAGIKGSGRIDVGLIHTPLGALSGATGDGTAVDNSASSANGAVGYMHCTALTLGGYTNLALKIRDSADNSTYADLVNFTAVTAAPDSERVAVAGTVDRYTRSNWAFTGAGTGQSATVFMGLKRL